MNTANARTANDVHRDAREWERELSDHQHEFGEIERSRFARTYHRKCLDPSCKFITLDLSDNEE